MKKATLIQLVFVFLLSISLFANQNSKGSLVIIGGALDPDNKEIYDRFIQLGGGKDIIHIAIIPAASATPTKSGQSYIDDFTKYGVPETHIKIFPLAVIDDPSTNDVNESLWSQNGSNKTLAEEILKYNAVFFVGGDQVRYRNTLIDKDGNDLPLLASIRRIYHRGGVIGGTSAGAAVMSDPMIISGDPTETINNGIVYQISPSGPDPETKTRLTKGFGFFHPGIVDQHFIKRGRAGRLIPSLLYSREQKMHTTGFGIDEDTAIIYKNNTVEVAGNSGVLIIDTSKAHNRQTPHGPKIRDIVLHYLEAGDSFNTQTRQFHINPKRKKIKKGNEYYEKYPLDTNILGKDALKELLTTGLVDNRQEISTGLAFTLQKNGTGTGMQFIFNKTKKTTGYFAKINGKETFSVLNVTLRCFPIIIHVKPAG